jgi:DNA-directed RNA polymerase specialized sigma24 family protein
MFQDPVGSSSYQSLANKSVSLWIHQLCGGDENAAQSLWQRYFQQLVIIARDKLKGRRPALGDEEDIALSAFTSFCRGAERGRFPKLSDRNDLWGLLVTITTCKTAHLLRDEGRKKRGGDWKKLSWDGGSDGEAVDLSRLIAKEPSPAFSAQCAESLDRLLQALNDPTLAKVALAKLEGYENREIAQQLDCALRSVERKLQLIRQIWQVDMETEPG